MKLFEAVKEAVTARNAAEYYGIKVGRNGMAVCPFHPDKNPSMKLDKRYHCFACQADGDVIDFTSRLFGLSSKEAALKLAEDFSISFDQGIFLYLMKNTKVITRRKIIKKQNKRNRHWINSFTSNRFGFFEYTVITSIF